MNILCIVDLDKHMDYACPDELLEHDRKYFGVLCPADHYSYIRMSMTDNCMDLLSLDKYCLEHGHCGYVELWMLRYQNKCLDHAPCQSG